MAIEQVHDLQKVYRKLLHSMSRPGTISSLQEVGGHSENPLPYYEATLHSIVTLLDGEVSFHILTENHQDLHTKISEYTLAKWAPIGEADYVIVLRDSLESSILWAVEECKNGNLIDPQASATWIIESAPLSNQDELTLTGPGIKDSSQLEVSLSSSFWQARNERTKEYPLGIDLIFTDEHSQIVCVPRTTTVVVKEVE
ncbi:phosphonate C-P lyase system protein PhnH [Halobacillus karajensis]|uniref:Alpha-D-ribose 1-methylphosphonate 5-triphosphate synthase subunit PhnH n=1 Tax=Halobacillus karajensis TaxID=195088 RepID=A0A024P3X2_9BACI|nr:phosphonate C-P lyase system protein PhnH [Halobacillus karajensis]CDQ20821.1 Alpha-D-ribose 1-methylphosphonate 5-triphosphate synthase subunit PhnH [Halobacillus karajensis]CDQ23709.1 Alpha-D-ribose 1-methylphosphonate 5-triphosphate synthase subunit PhnH [Halobacillus karajensis]CDQ27187.1 Alpha-D-ribose 1-methylphosphonate 5-triphosphate synthase subunit PhnH [Halobacillus karajensis]